MLDEWAESTASLQSRGALSSNLPHEDDDENYDAPVSNVSRNAESPIFSVDTLERQAAKGHGLVTSVSAGNNVILVGTNRGWLVRHDFGGGDTLELDLNTSRGIDSSSVNAFIDPGGRHSLATVISSTGADTYYMHAKWKKPRLLNRLKGYTFTAVAWNRQQISDAATSDFLLGTATGNLFALSIEEKDKKEKNLRSLFDISDAEQPFIGLQMETVGTPGTGTPIRYFIMAATPHRLYVFSGTGSPELVFLRYSDQIIHFTGLPGDIANSELLFYSKQRRLERFAWLAGPGVYHGNVNLGAQQSTNTEENFIDHKWLLSYSKISGEEPAPIPRSLAVTEFHFILLYHNSIKVVNTVSQEVVEEQEFEGQLDNSPMLGLCTDVAAGVTYAFNESSIFEVDYTAALLPDVCLLCCNSLGGSNKFKA